LVLGRVRSIVNLLEGFKTVTLRTAQTITSDLSATDKRHDITAIEFDRTCHVIGDSTGRTLRVTQNNSMVVITAKPDDSDRNDEQDHRKNDGRYHQLDNRKTTLTVQSCAFHTISSLPLYTIFMVKDLRIDIALPARATDLEKHRLVRATAIKANSCAISRIDWAGINIGIDFSGAD
jgi:hypothetical protein